LRTAQGKVTFTDLAVTGVGGKGYALVFYIGEHVVGIYIYACLYVDMDIWMRD